jgi:hypothetical protein
VQPYHVIVVGVSRSLSFQAFGRSQTRRDVIVDKRFLVQIDAFLVILEVCWTGICYRLLCIWDVKFKHSVIHRLIYASGSGLKRRPSV